MYRKTYRRYVPRPVRRTINTSARAGYRAIQTAVPRGTAARLGSSVGAAMGSSIAGKQGSSVGSYVGRRLGKQFARITGVGDYYLESGTKIESPFTAVTPILKSSISQNSVVISRSEYITDLYSGTGIPATEFKLDSFSVNPGLTTSDGGCFSWLPLVASGFQQYKFKQLVFEFRSTSGNAVSSTNSALGTVILAAQYDPTQDDFASKNEALNSQWAVSGGSDKSIMFPVECDPRQMKDKWYDVRLSPIKSNQNISLYDIIKLQVATQGLQEENQNLGELWVSYTVELTKFKTNPAYTYTAHWSNQFGGVAASDISTAYPLGNAVPIAAGPNDNLLMSIEPVARKINFPKYLPPNSEYLVLCRYSGTGAVGTTGISIGTLVNCEKVNLCSDNSLNFMATDVTNSVTVAFYIRITSADQASFIVTASNIPISSPRCDWYFVEMTTGTNLGAPYPGQASIPPI